MLTSAQPIERTQNFPVILVCVCVRTRVCVDSQACWVVRSVCSVSSVRMQNSSNTTWDPGMPLNY